jgi:23S rRNA (adenine1618-N6)-methyltransferase
MKKRQHSRQDKKPLTFHPKNKHKGRYDFDELILAHTPLKEFVRPSQYNKLSIDFSNAQAVKHLNTALLKHFYELKHWDIPKNYLCPPIPGRADYIHHVAQLLGSKNKYKIPMNSKVTCLDVGVGANCIYPIIGNKEYGWNFIGTDIDRTALDSAKNIINSNPELKDKIKFRFQENENKILAGVIKPKDKIDITICNPPFHSSAEEAFASTERKVKNLNKNQPTKVELNFGGVSNELWCNGGEKSFISKMINDSKEFGKQCYWFSTLVSKKENLKGIYKSLKAKNVVKIKTIDMGQGNKISRIVCWTFLTEEEQEEWMHNKWRDWSKS